MVMRCIKQGGWPSGSGLGSRPRRSGGSGGGASGEGLGLCYSRLALLDFHARNDYKLRITNSDLQLLY